MRKTFSLKKITLGLTLFLALYLAVSPMMSRGGKSEKLPGIDLSRFKNVIVFAPHPDDEILGCACTISKLKRLGAKVKIVVLTNGEGFKYAVQLANLTPSPSPKNYFDFAYERQVETTKALKLFGIEPGEIYFMGFPDRGISKLWSTNWSPDNPYKSPFTRTKSSLFRNSYGEKATYNGRFLADSIKSIIEKEKPDAIFLPNPDDAHIDHWSTYCFVNYALNEIQSGIDSNNKVELLSYLVHRGDFPLPTGYRPDLSLLPPKTLALDPSTKWHVFKNSKNDIEKKNAAILTFKSQLFLLKGFMIKFVRKNELFGLVPPKTAHKCPDGQIKLDGKPSDWKSVEPVILDPIRDTFLRKLEGNADLKSIWVARDNKNIYLRLDPRGGSSRFFYYKLDLSCFTPMNLVSRPLRFVISIKPQSINGVKWIQEESNSFRLMVATGKIIEVEIPLSGINYPSRIMIGAESSGPLQSCIDRTAYGTVYLH